MIRATGYWCYIGGDRYWHRTYAGAERRATAKNNFHGEGITQIISIPSGRLLWGVPA